VKLGYAVDRVEERTGPEDVGEQALIRGLATAFPFFRLLIAAVAVVAEIGDLSRFQNPRELMGYLGLVPSQRAPRATRSTAAASPRPGMVER
jgi:transposase